MPAGPSYSLGASTNAYSQIPAQLTAPHRPTAPSAAASGTMPPKKRGRKRLRSPPRTPNGKQETFLADYFPACRPLKIHLSALRASQGRILSRNLRAAGAVLFRDENATGPPAVVVTDRVPEVEEKGVTYVPPRWAEEVLRRRRAVSPGRYSLEATRVKRRKVAQEKSPAAASRREEKAETTKTPAVWQSSTVARADAAQRRAWIASLPAHAVERASVTECIHRSPNRQLSDMLRDLAKVRELAGDGEDAGAMRALAFRNAAAALASIPFAVSVDEVGLLRDAGSSVKDAVRECLERGSCKEARLLREDERVEALNALTAVHGVGFKRARKLYEAGVRNEEELVEFAKREEARRLVGGISVFDRPYDSLSLKQAYAFQKRVTEVLTAAGLSLRIVLCGGYRRCKSRGHDVDLLYCRATPPSSASQHSDPSQNDTSPLHDHVITALEKAGLLKHRLAGSVGPGARRARSFGRSEAHHAWARHELNHEVLYGVCAFDGLFFRADLVGVRDASEMPFATMAWTGSVAWQRSIRRWTKKRHRLIFSPHGLFDARTGERSPVGRGAVSEHDVFAAMGLEYRPPFERAA